MTITSHFPLSDEQVRSISSSSAGSASRSFSAGMMTESATGSLTATGRSAGGWLP